MLWIGRGGGLGGRQGKFMRARLVLAAIFIFLPAIWPAGVVSGANTWTGEKCSAWGPQKSIGTAFFAGYCANRRTVNGITYEVQRDDFYYYGGNVPVVTL